MLESRIEIQWLLRFPVTTASSTSPTSTSPLSAHIAMLFQVCRWCLPPRHEYLNRFRPQWAGFAYRCDACNQPVFLKFLARASDFSVFDEPPVEIERPTESFELQYLPDEVAEDFKEALTCYSNSCWNAFAAMTRRTLQSAATQLGSDGSTKVQKQLDDLHQMGVVEGEDFKQLKVIMLAGHDGAHPHLPKLSAERARRIIGIDKGRSISAIRKDGQDQRVRSTEK